MKSLVYILIILAIASLVLGVITKFASAINMVGGVGPTGFLIASIVFLLFGANFALLELLSKK